MDIHYLDAFVVVATTLPVAIAMIVVLNIFDRRERIEQMNRTRHG